MEEIQGLDTFTFFNAIEFIGTQNLRIRFKLAFIKLKINGSVVTCEGTNSNTTSSETMSIFLGF